MNTKEQIRQGSVARYGWAGATESSIDDGDLHRFAVLAQRLLQAEFGAVHIMDMDMQVRVAASSGAPLGVMNRSMTICEQILQTTPRPDVFWTADASQDEALVENPWVNGELGSIRYYAGAPLVGREGLPLGTLCVWSEQPAAEQTSIQLLRQLADAVMATLDARRDAAERAYAAEQVRNGALTPGSAAAFYSSPRPATRTLASADRGWNIDAVIDDRAVRTLFQPIVHLGTGSVVGYEALSRGPAGSALESPAALLGAAREVGRLGELDWLCRVHAMQAAAASRLHPSLSWFINVEPAGLDIACPEHLLAGLSQARSDLRVVLEVVERDVEGYVTHLLHAADQARQDAWGIALDDVGAEQGSLALLPFLQPDVVKLDMSLVHELPDNAAAATTAAVRAYAERRGAAILAEGIETEQQERLARVLGATYGQGFRYGRPGLLPESVPAPINVIPLRQRPEPLSGATPFEIGSAASTPERGTKSLLLHISAHLEAQCAELTEPAVLLASFQDRRYFTEAKRAKFQKLSEGNTLTVVIGDGIAGHAEPRFQVSPILAGSRMRHEWAVILLSPQSAAAFIARDCGDTGPDLQRRFDFVYTHDRSLVTTVARSFMQELLPDPTPSPSVDAQASRTSPSWAPEVRQQRRRSRFRIKLRQ